VLIIDHLDDDAPFVEVVKQYSNEITTRGRTRKGGKEIILKYTCRI
jgi:hypothetical protein